jgi:hypothetical protein
LAAGSTAAAALADTEGLMVRAILSTVGELFSFLWANKLWWMTPVVVVLLLFAGLLFLAQSSALAPFVYTLF